MHFEQQWTIAFLLTNSAKYEENSESNIVSLANV